MRNALIRCLALFVFTTPGGCAVAAELELRWEWPAERSPTHKIAANVTSLAPAKQGVAESPSIAAQLPDPMLLRGSVTTGRDDWKGRSFHLRVPQLELADIGVGDAVALGLVDDDVCICIAPMPGGHDETQTLKWLHGWNCTR